MNAKSLRIRSCPSAEHSILVTGPMGTVHTVRYSINDGKIFTFIDDVPLIKDLANKKMDVKVTLFDITKNDEEHDVLDLMFRDGKFLTLVMPDWFKYVRIVSLDLSYFIFPQEEQNKRLPIETFRFPWLKELRMNECYLSKILKINAPKLEKLDLSNNSGLDLKGIDRMYPNLKHLSLSLCDLTCISMSIYRLRCLEYLNISDNDFSDILLSLSRSQKLLRLINVKELNVSGCDLDEKEAKFLKCFPSLTSLNASNNDFNKIPKEIHEMLKTSLTSLNISSNNIDMFELIGLVENPNIKSLAL